MSSSAFEGRALSSQPSLLDRQQQQSAESYVLLGLTNSTTPKLRMLVRLVVLMMPVSSRGEDSAHFDADWYGAKAH